MSVVLTVGGIEYTFPSEGGNPPWGDEITSWATAITDNLSGLSNDNDILNSSAVITASQTDAPIAGFTFDTAVIRGAVVEYSLYRSGSTDKSETGIILLSYNGSSWSLARQADADVGVIFTITNSGIVKYTSDATGNGTLHYSVRTKVQ